MGENGCADLASAVRASGYAATARAAVRYLLACGDLDGAYVTRIQGDGRWQRVLYAALPDHAMGAHNEIVAWDDSLCARALALGEVVVPDASNRWASARDEPEIPGSYLCAPIYSGEGRLVGTLCGQRRHPDPGLPERVTAVASLLAALLGERLPVGDGGCSPDPVAGDTRGRLADQRLLQDFSGVCLTASDVQTSVVELACLMDAYGTGYRAVPFSCGQGEARASRAEDNALESHLDAVLAQGDTAVTQVANGGAALKHLDDEQTSLQRLRVNAGLDPFGPSLVIEAATTDDRYGGVVLLKQRGQSLSEAEEWLWQRCGDYLRLVTERLRDRTALDALNRWAQQAATHDTLTGLRNRRYVVEELDRMLAQADRLGEMIHVAFLNLDGFKAINDGHGHEVGDRFLIDIAQRLERTTRASDIVARYGGDEFVVVGPGIKPHDADYERQRLGERLSEATRGHYELDNLSLEYGGPSVGLVTSERGDTDADDLIARAQSAMQADKERRRWDPDAWSRVLA